MQKFKKLEKKNNFGIKIRKIKKAKILFLASKFKIQSSNCVVVVAWLKLLTNIFLSLLKQENVTKSTSQALIVTPTFFSKHHKNQENFQKQTRVHYPNVHKVHWRESKGVRTYSQQNFLLLLVFKTVIYGTKWTVHCITKWRKIPDFHIVLQTKNVGSKRVSENQFLASKIAVGKLSFLAYARNSIFSMKNLFEQEKKIQS